MDKKEMLEKKKLQLKKMAVIGGLFTAGVGALTGCNGKKEVVNINTSSNVTTEQAETENTQEDINEMTSVDYMTSILNAYNTVSNKEPLTIENLGILEVGENNYVYKDSNGNYFYNPKLTGADATNVGTVDNLYILIDKLNNKPISSVCMLDGNAKSVIVQCYEMDQNEMVLYDPNAYINIKNCNDKTYSLFEDYFNYRCSVVKK